MKTDIDTLPSKTGTTTKKSSSATVDQRIELIHNLILNGWESIAIVQNDSVKEWGITDRQIRSYIRRARTQMKHELAKYRVVALEEHIAARRKLRREAVDGRLALEILRDEAKLLGLYASKKKQNLNIDLSMLSATQLERIANGEDPINVLATSSKS